jgi:hypothetical protein
LSEIKVSVRDRFKPLSVVRAVLRTKLSLVAEELIDEMMVFEGKQDDIVLFDFDSWLLVPIDLYKLIISSFMLK